MRFTLEAQASEFPEKGPAFIERLAKALDPVSPQLADSIRSVIPEHEQHELRYPVLQALRDQMLAIYKDQLKLMLDDVDEVLQEAPAEHLRLNKAGGPYIGPRGGKWANPEHTEAWVEGQPKAANKKITDILNIVDTRQYELSDRHGRFVPIPGSGHENKCERCGKSHEVHATVKCADGSTAIVGTGCMGADEIEPKKVAKITAGAKRLKALQAEVDHLTDKLQKEEAFEATLAPPEPVIDTTPAKDWDGSDIHHVVVGDVRVPFRLKSIFSDQKQSENDARATATGIWKTKRRLRNGIPEPGNTKWDLKRAKEKLDKVLQAQQEEAAEASATPEEIKKAGPYIGPRGGKWADPEHTEAWHEGAQQEETQHGHIDAGLLQRYAQRFGTKPKENMKVGLEFFHEMGVPARMLSADDPQWIRDGIKRKGAAFRWSNPETGKSEIVINPYANFWKDPNAHAQQHGDTGDKFFSTDHPMRALVHEYGHHVYTDTGSSESNFINDHAFREKVQAEVGKYAASNVHEFIAEVYAGLLTGRTYSPLIMDHYNSYKELRFHPQGDSAGLAKAGPYIGPKGGKWANPQHTIHWDPADHSGKSFWNSLEEHGVKIKPHHTDPDKMVLKAPKEMAGKLAELKEAAQLPDPIIQGAYYSILPISKKLFEQVAQKTAGQATQKPAQVVAAKMPSAQPSSPVVELKAPAYGKHAWAPHKSVAEAKAWAKQFGVETGYKDLDTANAVNGAMAGQHPWVLKHMQFVGSESEMHAWAKANPAIVSQAKHEANHPADLTTMGLESAIALAHPITQKPYTQSVVVVKDSWGTEAKYKQHGKEASGFSRTTNLADTLRHEMGHVEGFVLRHVRPFGAKGPSAWDIWKKHCAAALQQHKPQVAKEISQYATTNPHECWAEVAVMRRTGAKLPEWVEEAIAEMRIDHKPWDIMAPGAIWGKAS